MTSTRTPPSASTPLLVAKQHVPRVPMHAIGRRRLTQRLLDTGGVRATLLVAPAGWGKTTLLAQWARDPHERRRIAWVSLDHADSEPTRFWSYVLSALETIAPQVTGGPLRALRMAGLDPVDVALPMLLNELAGIEDRHVLVLDDYHALGADGRVHEQVEFLLAYLPPALHLVISARTDPPLPLARLRSRGELVELHADDLRFTPDETAGLLSAAGVPTLRAESTAWIAARTEGWAAGLRLAALTVRSAPDPDVRAMALRGDDRHLMDFFVEEVLVGLTSDQRELLTRCSVLERLSGPLCDALLGRGGSGPVLAGLESAGVFVVALDPQCEWYRCHQLFRDVLGRQLDAADPTARRVLLTRAAEWFVAHDQLDEAVRHLIAGGDHAAAAQLLVANIVWFVARGASGEVFRLGSALDPKVARADPLLCVDLAWASAWGGGRPDKVREWLDAAEPFIGPDTPAPEGWHSAAGAAAFIGATTVEAWTGGVEGALAEARRAIELEVDPAQRGYALARVALGRVLLGAGRAEEAAAVLSEAWQLPLIPLTSPVLRMQTVGELVAALLRTGEHERARRLCREFAAAADELEATWGDAAAPALTLLRTAEGQLAHARGDLPAARRILTRTVDLARVWNHDTHLVAALAAAAEAELAAGHRSNARTLLNEAHEAAADGPILPAAREALRVAEGRVGRRAVLDARHEQHVLVEELTDRERSILRALPGPLTLREIGGELFLSLNTVKGYTKSLYRKLGVSGREEAVSRARAVGLL
jgi:LuxR family maltose regulon positive regulatory protein